ncbi:MAG: CoA transferase [Alphaproteobacteria bacterium]|nr:CoA transferase [Alphaproteobacteria bacterium]
MLERMSYELPYKGLKVLEISQGYAAPYCAMMLAQYGAEVIKIEPPHGDWVRGVGKAVGDHTALSIVPNIGKKNLALDLKSEEGNAIARRLAAEADVIVEAGRPGVAARLGLGYDQVRADNPRVIYVSVSGFGQAGPYVDRPVTDTVMQSFSGLMSVNRGVEDGVPHRVGCIVVDHMTGVYAFQSVAAALFARQDEDEGRFIDISLMSSTAALMAPKFVEHQLQDGAPRIANAPAGSYETKDGWMAVTLIKEEHWVKICDCMGHPELATDSRFQSFDARAENLDELLKLIRPIFRGRTTEAWMETFRENDILSNRINDLASWLADPQVIAANAAPMVTQPHAGPTPIVHIPGTAPPRDGDPRSEAPLTGAHSREVLARLGYSDKDIDALAAQGVTKLAE